MTAPLFGDDTPAAAVASGARAPTRAPDPAASDAALVGDGFGWLAALLPAPRPPVCERCRRPMVLPAGAPVLWTCPACHPQEVDPRG